MGYFYLNNQNLMGQQIHQSSIKLESLVKSYC
jgi:hypothetical protein